MAGLAAVNRGISFSLLVPKIVQLTRSPRVRRVLRRALVVVLGAYVLYLVLANVFLGFHLLDRVATSDDGTVELRTGRAWSLWPGRASVRDFVLRLDSDDLQLRLTVAKATTSVSLWRLLRHQVSLSDVEAEGTSFRLRMRVESIPPEDKERIAAYPEIELNLRSDTHLVDFERDRELDAALRFGPGHWPGLTAVPLFGDWITPVASPGLLAQLGKTCETPLAELPLLGDPGGRWKEWFASFGGSAPSRYVASFSDSESLHRAATEGLGVALGRMTLARPLLDHGRLVALCTQRLASEYSHYLVYPARSAEHAGLAAFRGWIEAQARLWRDQDAAAFNAGPSS